MFKEKIHIHNDLNCLVIGHTNIGHCTDKNVYIFLYKMKILREVKNSEFFATFFMTIERGKNNGTRKTYLFHRLGW